jgi:hypothetical protein
MTVGTFQPLVIEDECLQRLSHIIKYDPWDGVNFPSKPIIWLKKREFGLPII